MKNRRLNVLFIALIALAAAPQAFWDAHRLANAAQERVEAEFWSVFLSYQMPDSNGGGRPVAGKEIVAAPRNEGTDTACPLRQMVASQGEAARVLQSNSNMQARARANSEVRRESAKAKATAPETVVPELDNDTADEAVAAEYTVRSITFTEKEQKALKSAAMHARGTEKVIEVAQRAALASFMQQNEDARIKTRQLLNLDRALRQKTRNSRDRETPEEMSVPGPVGSM
jgi:hypothetical protein